MKKRLSIIIPVCMFFVGLSVLLYPSVSDYYNSKIQASVISEYEQLLADIKPKDYSEIFNAAEEYNRNLYSLNHPLLEHKDIKNYEEVLNINGSGVMGYIDIDKLELELPIYHGISADVLSIAAGHVEGSSLPIGGENTHAVLSAHRGLPSAKLFSDLDKVEVGDVFRITVLDRVFIYKVDQILIVEPEDVKPLEIEPGKDYCTLVTCTPYGINTHRLLVRGVRIDHEDEKASRFVPNEAMIIDPIIVTPVVALPMLLILMIVLFIKYRKR